MSASSDHTRLRLIERILKLPDATLAHIDEALARMEAPAAEALPGVGTAQDYWPHAPVHRISEHGTYIVTAGTYQKQHLFRGAERLELLETSLLKTAHETGWDLEAWAVFSNHYHFVGHSRADSAELGEFTKQLHGRTAVELNHSDKRRDRQIWHNYWDTRLTYESSYFARLNYVHQNAVKHGLVQVANQYRWCSAAWFERMATRAQVNTIYRFKIDTLKVRDEFDPEWGVARRSKMRR